MGYKLKSLGMNGLVLGNDNCEFNPQFDHSCEIVDSAVKQVFVESIEQTYL